jgi:hypothetical protein
LSKRQEKQVEKLKTWIEKNIALECLLFAILLPIENMRKNDHFAKILLEVFLLLDGKQKVDGGFRILEAGKVPIRDLGLDQRQLAGAFSSRTDVQFFCLFTVQDIPELSRFLQFGYDEKDIAIRIQICEGKQAEWLLRINEDYEEVVKLKKTKVNSKKENLRGIVFGNCRTKEPQEIVYQKCGNCTSVSYCSRNCQVR